MLEIITNIVLALCGIASLMQTGDAIIEVNPTKAMIGTALTIGFFALVFLRIFT